MSEPNDDGGPAFPVIAANGLGHIADGMSLRDWFAGQALAAIVQADGMQFVATPKAWSYHAEYAYAHADAMLAERGK